MKINSSLSKVVKSIKNTRFLAILGGLLILSFAYSCKKSAHNKSEMVLDKNLLKSADKYEQLLAKRSNTEGSFSIEDIKRNGDILTISVKGGCAEDDFQMVWDGLILTTYPSIVRLVLHNTASKGCDKDNRLNVEVNLSKIIGKHAFKDYVFQVSNGSVKQDHSLNPDGSVSSK